MRFFELWTFIWLNTRRIQSTELRFESKYISHGILHWAFVFPRISAEKKNPRKSVEYKWPSTLRLSGFATLSYINGEQYNMCGSSGLNNLLFLFLKYLQLIF